MVPVYISNLYSKARITVLFTAFSDDQPLVPPERVSGSPYWSLPLPLVKVSTGPPTIRFHYKIRDQRGNTLPEDILGWAYEFAACIENIGGLDAAEAIRIRGADLAAAVENHSANSAKNDVPMVRILKTLYELTCGESLVEVKTVVREISCSVQVEDEVTGRNGKLVRAVLNAFCSKRSDENQVRLASRGYLQAVAEAGALKVISAERISDDFFVLVCSDGNQYICDLSKSHDPAAGIAIAEMARVSAISPYGILAQFFVSEIGLAAHVPWYAKTSLTNKDNECSYCVDAAEFITPFMPVEIERSISAGCFVRHSPPGCLLFDYRGRQVHRFIQLMVGPTAIGDYELLQRIANSAYGSRAAPVRYWRRAKSVGLGIIRSQYSVLSKTKFDIQSVFRSEPASFERSLLLASAHIAFMKLLRRAVHPMGNPDVETANIVRQVTTLYTGTVEAFVEAPRAAIEILGNCRFIHPILNCEAEIKLSIDLLARWSDAILPKLHNASQDYFREISAADWQLFSKLLRSLERSVASVIGRFWDMCQSVLRVDIATLYLLSESDDEISRMVSMIIEARSSTNLSMEIVVARH